MNEYIGFWSSSNDSQNNSIIIPFACKITHISFYIKKKSPANTNEYTATIFNTRDTTAISNSSVSTSASTGTSAITVELVQNQLITIRITGPSGTSLVSGVLVTLVAELT